MTNFSPHFPRRLRFGVLAPLFFLTLAVLIPTVRAGDRSSFDTGWRFQKGDATNAESAAFDDSGWRALDLPHDWAIEGPFDKKYNARAGGLPFYGVGWYRKTFALPAEAKGRRVSIEFEGAMNNATVWLNGVKLGEHPYGYTGFGFDLTPHLKSGGENVVAVRLAPEDLSSRWYPGAGLYRRVWLDLKNPVHLAQWGVFVSTPKITDAKGTVRVQTRIENTEAKPREITLRTSVESAPGVEVAAGDVVVTIEPLSSRTVEQDLTVKQPRRWDVSDPHLYTALSLVKAGDQALDRRTTRFGIRTIEFHPDKGFLLNGRRVQFQGVCNHHDLGALGAAVNRRATQRQLEIMRDMGVNSIRTSHNPPSTELLELCDEMGLLVLDEAFDVWRVPKVENGYNKFFNEWHERDLTGMVQRDRNHPSIIMWSIGNEIIEQWRADGAVLARRLSGIVRAEDPTRPVTAGFNGYPESVKNKLADQLDVVGFNYKPAHYEEILRQHPHWVVVGAETASTVSTRGVYHLPIEKYERHDSKQVTSYDIISPPWAYPPEVEWSYLAKNPRMLGEFIWTGFDYLGEPTPYGGQDNVTGGQWNSDWPAHGSYFGAVDLAGFPKDRFYLYQSQWTQKPMVHLLPHWNWQGREGDSIPVMAYTTGDTVELFLNGKSLGRRRKGIDLVELPVSFSGYKEKTFASPYRVRWDVPYQPGTLKAVASKDGQVIAETEIRTAGKPARLKLSADRAKITADGQDLSFVTVRVEDADGNLCPLADNLVTFKVTGAGALAAVDNGDPISLESFQADHRQAFNGLCLAIVRPTNQPGEIKLVAAADGLESATTVITSAGGAP